MKNGIYNMGNGLVMKVEDVINKDIEEQKERRIKLEREMEIYDKSH